MCVALPLAGQMVFNYTLWPDCKNKVLKHTIFYCIFEYGTIKELAMDNQASIERYGGIIKEEPLSCVDNDIILKNTCVFEADSPYFGYYNEVPHTSKPHMTYFILDKYFSLEFLMRATSNVQKKVKFKIDCVTGSITMFNQTCYVIRFLGIENYSHIALLQEKYLEEGITFKKKSRTFQHEMAMIKLRRFFSFIPAGEGMFLESNQPNFGYFALPEYINWENFKKLTTEVKYDTGLLYFDAASAYVFQNNGIMDMVRIYRENLTKENLKAIKDRYLKLLD